MTDPRDTLETPPLSEEELDTMRAEVNRCDPEFGRHRWSDFERLVSELRRLRSDEWLEKAVEEIAASWVPRAVMYGAAPNKFEARSQALREVLRKHRDAR